MWGDGIDCDDVCGLCRGGHTCANPGCAEIMWKEAAYEAAKKARLRRAILRMEHTKKVEREIERLHLMAVTGNVPGYTGTAKDAFIVVRVVRPNGEPFYVHIDSHRDGKVGEVLEEMNGEVDCVKIRFSPKNFGEEYPSMALENANLDLNFMKLICAFVAKLPDLKIVYIGRGSVAVKDIKDLSTMMRLMPPTLKGLTINVERVC